MNRTKTYKITATEVEKNNAALQEGNLTNNSMYDEAADEIKKQREEDRLRYDLTSISECQTVAMHEYDLERNKKQSFDNRAGIIITVFAAISISIYDKIPMAEVIAYMSQPLTFIILLKIVVGSMTYISLISSLFFAVRVIAVKGSDNFDIRIINGNFISSAKIDSVSKLTEIYLNLARKHRSKNEGIANKLAYSQWSMITSIVSILIYLIIQGVNILAASGQQSCDIRPGFLSHSATVLAVSGQ